MATVLIVDDDSFIRKALEKILNQDPVLRGFDLKVLTAEDGVKGLERYREVRPEFLVVDLLMPQLDGFGVCEAVRKEPGGDKTQIAVISGVYRDKQIVDRVEHDYGAKFFTKPYQLKELTKLIARALGQSPGTKRAPTPVPESASKPSFGNLSARSLAAVLLDLLDVKATGVLMLKRGKVIKRAHLFVGHPLAVESNVRNETLGGYLQARGVLSNDQLKQAVGLAARERMRMGEALIKMGVLTAESLLEKLSEQAKFKLVNSLRWPDGEWHFSPSEVPQTQIKSDPIDVAELVVDGLAQSSVIEPLPLRVAELQGRPLRLNDRGQLIRRAVSRFVSEKLIDVWADGATIESLLSWGVDRVSLFTAMDVLTTCDALEVEGPIKSQSGGLLPAADSFTVSDLSDHTKSTRARPPPIPGKAKPEELYTTLFGDSSSPGPAVSGAIPLEIDSAPDLPLDDGDSGVLDVRDIDQRVLEDQARDDQNRTARRKLLTEFLRVQGANHYAVLKVDHNADAATISAALAQVKSEHSHEWYSRYDLGRDYAKIEDIHDAYRRARDVLLDDAQRAKYDKVLVGESKAGQVPSLQAEIAYRGAEDLLSSESYAAAIAKLETAIELCPEEASYHATLGWAVYLRGRRNPKAADEARPHLNHALSIDPDNASAHEYKGIISAELETDDAEAAFHLSRALDADPGRADALEYLEMVFKRQGELRPLERQYRKLVHLVSSRDKTLALSLWLKLAHLYRNELNDVQSARVAYTAAANLAPNNGAVQAALADLDTGAVGRFHEHSQRLRSAWRKNPSDPTPGIELMNKALDANRPDAAFAAASALVALNEADERAEELFGRYRPKFVVRAQRTFEDEVWDELRHTRDDIALGALFALLAPIVNETIPTHLADLEVEEGTELEEAQLPDAFARVRSYAAHMLGVEVPLVYARSDFGHQIHVGATTPPVLLAGDDVLSSPERGELAFRLGRAMTYLRPGRALAGSHPSRFLKELVLAVYAATHPKAKIEVPASVVPVRDRVRALPDPGRTKLGELVTYITQNNARLNLTGWVQALARTADRVGLVLCGDLPAAVRFVKDGGTREHANELIDFAMSPGFLKVRAKLGLSIDV